MLLPTLNPNVCSSPAEFSTYLNLCRSLRFDDKPDYSYLRQLFRNLFHRQGFSYDYVFDWNMLKFVSYLPKISICHDPSLLETMSRHAGGVCRVCLCCRGQAGPQRTERGRGGRAKEERSEQEVAKEEQEGELYLLLRTLQEPTEPKTRRTQLHQTRPRVEPNSQVLQLQSGRELPFSSFNLQSQCVKVTV